MGYDLCPFGAQLNAFGVRSGSPPLLSFEHEMNPPKVRRLISIIAAGFIQFIFLNGFLKSRLLLPNTKLIPLTLQERTRFLQLLAGMPLP
jgi:hypothetical protein